MTKKISTYRRMISMLPKLEAQYQKAKGETKKRLGLEISQYKNYISKIDNHKREGGIIYSEYQKSVKTSFSKKQKVAAFNKAAQKCKMENDTSFDIKIAMCRKYLLRHGVLIDKSIWEQD